MKNLQRQLGSYDISHESLSKEWINERLRNHHSPFSNKATWGIASSHLVSWIELLSNTYKNLPKCKFGLDTISISYAVDWIKNMYDILD